MLLELEIRNFALVERTSLRFSSGLNVITGETGAGKSVVLRALSLLGGGRAGREVIREGADEAIISALFEAQGNEVLISREITPARSLYRLDGKLATAALARERMMGLLQVIGQGEAFGLVRADWQLELLDGFGKLTRLREEVRAMQERLRRLRRNAAADDPARLEFLRFQLAELERAGLRSGEDDELAEERRVLSERARLTESLEASLERIGGGRRPGGRELIAEAARLLERAGMIDGRLVSLSQELQAAEIAIGEIEAEIRRHLDMLSERPGRLEEIEERLAFITALKRKHGVDMEGLIRRREELALEAAAWEERLRTRAEEEREERRLADELEVALAELFRRRREAAAALSAAVEAEMGGVGLPGAAFRVEVGTDTEGRQRVDFLFQPNPGESLRPLGEVASGGELSRLMLTLRGLVAAGGVATLVLDEVDQGIGGRAAEVVADRLQRLGREVQVIAVTHLPIVAAAADCHLLIRKVEKKGRLVTVAESLDREARQAELARMIGGDPVTAARHAERLLARGIG